MMYGLLRRRMSACEKPCNHSFVLCSMHKRAALWKKAVCPVVQLFRLLVDLQNRVDQSIIVSVLARPSGAPSGNFFAQTGAFCLFAGVSCIIKGCNNRYERIPACFFLQ